MPPSSLASRIGLLLLALLVLFFAWRPSLDDEARTQVKADLARAAAVFATARAIGATLSVAQSANVDLKLFGTGVGVAPGQALRPVQEFVDRFAALMLAVSVAFGVQWLLLEIGAHPAASALLSAAVGLMLLMVWRGRPPTRWVRLAQALLVFLLLVRFAVPLSVAANGLVYDAVMARHYEAAVQTLDRAPLAEPAAATEAGRLAGAREWFRRMADPQAAIESLLARAGDWADRMIRLMALFVIQTIVLPLLFIGLFWRACRLLLQALAPVEPA